MNLLRKYYDKDSIGGGIPDDVRKKISDIYPHRGGYSIQSLKTEYEYNGALVGYSLASGKLKEKDEEISRLKEENERLRGALSELYDVVFKGENVFKSLDKAHEVLKKPNITIVQSKNK